MIGINEQIRQQDANAQSILEEQIGEIIQLLFDLIKNKDELAALFRA